MQEVLVSIVKQLYQLQLVDTEWDEKSRRLALVEASLAESGDVLRAREAVAETEGHLHELRKKLHALELEIAGLNDKLKANQERLYGGRVRNPKELGSLQQEATVLQRHRSELEDGQLESMIAIEEQEAELAERQARRRQIEATRGEEQAVLQAEKEQLAGRLAELEEQRTGLRQRLRAADLADYDDLRRRQGGTAVALLKRGTCQACGVDVPTTMARAVEHGEGMHYCPICNRLLYGG
jgi:hypothetical protein